MSEMTKTKLSVNINKIALIRNARGSNLPDLTKISKDIESFGADGITVHPRPDQRHIRYDDIPVLKKIVSTEFNIEGYPSPDFLKLVLDNAPHQCTLVPDPPGALTSDSGWDTKEHRSFLTETVGELKAAGIRVSLFLNPEPGMVEGACLVGADRVELYTGNYANDYATDRSKAVAPHIATAKEAAIQGIGLNAGHDFNLENLRYYQEQVPGLLEVSIGHALVCDALYFGLANTVQMYQRLLK